jgi:hypothetical protein
MYNYRSSCHFALDYFERAHADSIPGNNGSSTAAYRVSQTDTALSDGSATKLYRYVYYKLMLLSSCTYSSWFTVAQCKRIVNCYPMWDYGR